MPYPATGKALILVKKQFTPLMVKFIIILFSCIVLLCYFVYCLHCEYKGFFAEMQSSQWKDLAGTRDLDQAPANGRELMLVLNFTI